MSEYHLIQLSNGIRIAHREQPNTRIVHCGVMLDIGSRDENESQVGLAHFWEHMAFKGTKKRKSYHIINRLESVGGELNAYTTKEKVCFYASVLDQHFEKSAELLADITFNSVFPDKQLDMERGVILEEMSMYQDAPEDAIQDDFDEVIFPNHPLGKNILGTLESVQRFGRKDLQMFVSEHLDTHKIVFSVVGNIPLKKVQRIAEKYFGLIPEIKKKHSRNSPNVYSPKELLLYKPISQAHVALGKDAFNMHHPDRIAFFTLVNLLGGPGMNSRFNLSLREKNGLVYSIDANYTSYTDTGYLGIYFATDPKNLNKALRLVYKELKELREKPLGEIQLKTVKEQLKGQLAMAEESNQSYMLVMAKSILDVGFVEPLPQVFKQIDALSSSYLQDIAQRTLREDELSKLSFIPEN